MVTGNRQKHIYEFGSFRLDTGEQLLLRDGIPIGLTPKAFETLVALVESKGQLVEKDELIRRLWPDTVVEENNLTKNVWALRKALGETVSEPYIKTIPKRGYRFAAAVRELKEVKELPSASPEPMGPQQVSADVAAEDEKRTGKYNDRDKQLPGVSGLALAVSLAVVGLAGWLSHVRMSGNRMEVQTSAAISSIAVLPFKTLDMRGDESSLGLGMADAVIGRIGKTPRITVRPTRAVQQYVGRAEDPIAAGRELKVDAVLEGSLQRVGDAVDVRLRLVSVRDGATIWADRRQEKATGFLALRDSISFRAATAPPLRSPREPIASPIKGDTDKPDAHEAYVKGLVFWNQRIGSGYTKAMEYFRQAIAIDPDYAPAYAGLASVNFIYGDVRRGEQLALRSLAIDDSLPEAHAALGFFRMFHQWDWMDAERELKRAIDLNPNYATAHQWYALLLASTGRLEEAEARMRRGHEIDPLSLVINADLGQVLYFERKYDEAIAQCLKTLEMDADFLFAHDYLAWAYAKKGMDKEAVDQFLQSRTITGNDPRRLATWRQAYADAGIRGFLQSMIDWQEKGPSSPALNATFYALLGEEEQALDWLRKACDAHDFFLYSLKADPVFDNLRTDARFADLERRMGLTP